MRMPIQNIPGRAHKSLAAGALSPHEAAVRLARIEFDVARLEREVEASDRRIEAARKLLERHQRDRKLLLQVIDREPSTNADAKGRRVNAA